MTNKLSLPFIYGAQYYRAPTRKRCHWEKDLKQMADSGFNMTKLFVQWRWTHIDEIKGPDGSAFVLRGLKNESTLDCRFKEEMVGLYSDRHYAANATVKPGLSGEADLVVPARWLSK